MNTLRPLASSTIRTLALTGRLSFVADIPEEAALVHNHGHEEDVALMCAHLAGDNVAFGSLFDRHHMRLYLYCARMLGNSTSAEDIMQEVWERMIRLRERPEQIRHPIAYLFTVARRLCLNQLRGAQRFTPLQPIHEEIELDVRSDLKELVVEALEHLPLPYREVLTLQVYAGYGLEEMAPMLGISPAAVWKRASRARTMLREAVSRIEAYDTPKPTTQR